MQYSTKVDKTEESLTEVVRLISQIEEDRVFSAIISKRLSHDDLVEYTTHLKEIRQRQLREIEQLKKFAKQFNKEYATNHNKCFSTAQRLFNLIRSNMKETLNMFKKFCPRNNLRGPYLGSVEMKPSVLTHSLISEVSYTPDMFGPSSYCDHATTEFITELGQFFEDVQDALLMCEDVLKEESIIRKDTVRCLNLYERCCNEVLESSTEFVEYFGEDGFQKEDEMSKDMNKANSLQLFIQNNFHYRNKNQFRLHVLHKNYSQAREDKMTDIEGFLWPTDHSRAFEARTVLAHFDELEPKGKLDKQTGRYKLDGDYVAVFMEWCGINQSKKENKFVNRYFAENYKGEFQMIAYSTVNSAKSRLLRDAEKVQRIRSKIDALLHKHNA